MIAISYYLLVVVARGGWASYSQQTLWAQFFSLGYSVGDAIIFTIALAIFGLSWKHLGGRFKYPILTILAGFGVMYIADTVFNYRSLNNTYYNGDISDILYLASIIILCIALCMLDPSRPKYMQTANSATSVPETSAFPQGLVAPPPVENLPPQGQTFSQSTPGPTVNKPDFQSDTVLAGQTLADEPTISPKTEENN